MGLFFENSGESSNDIDADRVDITPSASADQNIPSNDIDADRVDIVSQSEADQLGTPNSLGQVSTDMQSSGNNNSAFSGLQNLLGSVGNVAKQLGTAAGAIQRVVSGAPGEFDAAKKAALSPSNKIQTWVKTAPTTDKLTVFIGLAGLYFVAFK